MPFFFDLVLLSAVALILFKICLCGHANLLFLSLSLSLICILDLHFPLHDFFPHCPQRKQQLANEKVGKDHKHGKSFLGFDHAKYDGSHSEGNRFIRDDDL